MTLYAKVPYLDQLGPGKLEKEFNTSKVSAIVNEPNHIADIHVCSAWIAQSDHSLK